MDKTVLCLLVLVLIVAVKGSLNLPSCGTKPESRIVGGTVAPDGAWPWQAMIMIRGKQYCGGTLVTNQWVVTAAHCVVNYTTSIPMNVNDFRVRPLRESHDIALVRLERPAMLNRRVSLACLPNNQVHFAAGKLCWVTGWGKKSWQGVKPERLHQAMVPLRNNSDCENSYPNAIHRVSMICAGYPSGGVDACQYDSGGPLVCKHGHRWYLTGVTSWGAGCAWVGKYGVYARVPNLITWINHVIANN